MTSAEVAAVPKMLVTVTDDDGNVLYKTWTERQTPVRK
jgi:hypothetical protein